MLHPCRIKISRSLPSSADFAPLLPFPSRRRRAEEVAVTIQGHYNRSVAEPLLHDLGRQLKSAVGAPVDTPAGIEVPQCVQSGVLRLAAFIGNAGRALQRDQYPVNDVGMALDATDTIGEYQPGITLRASEPPFLKSRKHKRAERDCPLRRLRFRLANDAIPVRALPDLQFAAPEIDVLPTQTTKLRRA